MKSISTQELKSNLDAILSSVQAGQIVLTKYAR